VDGEGLERKLREERERLGGQRKSITYRNIDANLSSLDVLGEFTRRAAALGEDGNAVTVFVCVDDIDGFIERFGVQADEYRSKDFFLVAGHVLCHVCDDCGTDLYDIPISEPSL